MRVLLLTAVALTAVAICSAAKKDPECVYRKQRKLQMHWANPNACDRFYRCSDNLKTEVICDKGKLYNSDSGKCSKATKDLCKLSLIAPIATEDNVCATEVTGAYVSRSGTCRDFFICHEKAAYLQSCPVGTYFDETSANCLPDVNNKCSGVVTFAASCTGVADGTYVANPDNCRSFYVCNGGSPVLQECDSGSYFTADNNCQPDPDNSLCWENFCIGKPDATWVPNNDDCHSFYVCNNQQATAQTCPTDSYFDKKELRCEPGTCTDDESSTECSEGTTTEDPCTEPPVTEDPCTESPATAKAIKKQPCPANVVDGEFLPHPTNCMHFFICVDGNLEELDCLPGNFYDLKEKICKHDANAQCPATQEALKELKKIQKQNEKEDKKEKVKENEKEKEKQKEKKIEEENVKETVKDEKTEKKKKKESRPKRSVGPVPEKRFFLTKELLPEDHDALSEHRDVPMNDYYYPMQYQFSDPHPVMPNKQVFFKKELPEVVTKADETSAEATTEASVEEIKDISSAEKQELLTNLLDQHRLYLKKENLKKRPLNHEVNLGHLEKIEEEAVTEVSVESVEDPMLELTDEEKEKIMEAVLKKHERNPEQSATSVTDELMAAFLENLNKHLSSHNSQNTHNDFPPGVIGVKYLEKETMSEYPEEFDGMRTDQSSNPLICKGRYYRGEMLPIANDCRRFEICNEDGELKAADCGNGNYFNYTAQVCLPDKYNICPQLACQGRYYVGDMISLATNCRRFQICDDDGELKYADCGYGNYFDEAVGACRYDRHNICADATAVEIDDDIEEDECANKETGCTCPGGYAEGTQLPNQRVCYKYYVCQSGRFVSFECGDGEMFMNSECVPDLNNVCWTNGENPGNQSTICSGLVDGTLLPVPNVCNSYYYCYQGQPEIKECDRLQYFHNGQCVDDVSAVCVNPCEDIPGIQLMPYPSNPSKYYMCNGGITYIMNCPKGTAFDITTNNCTGDATTIENLCDNLPDGTTVANPDDDTLFYLCMGGEAHEKTCLDGYVFDTNFGVCKEPPNPNCDQDMCASGDYLAPFTPISGNDTEFCICLGYEAYIKNCPDQYVFSAERGVCYSNAPCDPEMCQGMPEYTAGSNRNSSDSFCLCVAGKPMIIDCPEGYTFSGISNRCLLPTPQDDNCDATYCRNQPDYTTFESESGLDGFCLCEGGNGTYHTCQAGYEFSLTVLVCVPPMTNAGVCDIDKCTGEEFQVFPVPQHENFFCLCQDGNTPLLRECPVNYKFDSDLLICLPELCNKAYCKSGQPEFVPFPANDNNYGFCLCDDSSNATFYSCPEGKMYDSKFSCCIDEILVECDITGCAVPGKDYPYPIATVTNENAFCMCWSSTVISFQPCPSNMFFNVTAEVCEPVLGPTQSPNDNECDECANVLCPGGYQNGQTVPHDSCCDKYYKCDCGNLVSNTCPENQYYAVSQGSCQNDTTESCKSALNRNLTNLCLGMYRNSQRLAHPTNTNAFYLCYNGKLHEEYCDPNFIFDPIRSVCLYESVKKPVDLLNQDTFDAINNKLAPLYAGRQKRAAETDETEPVEDLIGCVDGAKRVISSNCTQYEICHQDKWHKRTCPRQRYYNSEKQICLEPLDDMECEYVKVSGLPECNDRTEQLTWPTKNESNCIEYYRCTNKKWRIEMCLETEFYSRVLRSCLPLMYTKKLLPTDACVVRSFVDTQMEEFRNLSSNQTLTTTEHCIHTSMLPLEHHCGMYIMCLENEWWYQYCPRGMFFNTTLNYCVPNDNGQCLDADDFQQNKESKDKISEETCIIDSMTRPSALSCDKYYSCNDGKWHLETCPESYYFDVSSGNCLLDVDNVCEQINAVCQNGEQRSVSLNCTAYEACTKGDWQRLTCTSNHYYDDILQQCALNSDGICGSNGLRKACHPGETRTVRSEGNCTQFFYCKNHVWQIGACLKGLTFSDSSQICVPHAIRNTCQARFNQSDLMNLQVNHSPQVDDGDIYSCVGREDGVSVPHEEDCTRFYVCLDEAKLNEQQCVIGSFFDQQAGFCRPNDGSCRVPLTGACENATDGDLLPHHSDCRAYYQCSTINGTQLLYCPEGQYYHNATQQCRIDNGECLTPSVRRCSDSQNGAKLEHETYCDIYYACMHSFAVPIKCPMNEYFNPVLRQCFSDDLNTCTNGTLSNGTDTIHSCGNLTDGTYLSNRTDCTRYFICSNGLAEPKRCSSGTYFDAKESLCIPDDGTCPFVDDDDSPPDPKPLPPDPAVCEGKHGTLIPDDANCNEFYVCINGKLKHERCYENHFFNKTIQQCYSYDENNGSLPESRADSTLTADASNQPVDIKVNVQEKCHDKPTNFSDLCSQIDEGSSIAEQGDCRRYITCEDDKPVAQRCRNGESYDSLLGFCRQNDGTCLLENGQRVGECQGYHGQLVRDTENCQGYFVCINGQKIASECGAEEYFDKTLNICQKDTTAQCVSKVLPPKSLEVTAVSCTGLSETILYPYVASECRSYFQCIGGSPKIHECADNLFFNMTTVSCVREISECLMPAVPSNLPIQNLLRTPEIHKANICDEDNTVVGRKYANVDEHCKSYYVCNANGDIAHTSCSPNTLFNTDTQQCESAKDVICKA